MDKNKIKKTARAVHDIWQGKQQMTRLVDFGWFDRRCNGIDA